MGGWTVHSHVRSEIEAGVERVLSFDQNENNKMRLFIVHLDNTHTWQRQTSRPNGRRNNEQNEAAADEMPAKRVRGSAYVIEYCFRSLLCISFAFHHLRILHFFRLRNAFISITVFRGKFILHRICADLKVSIIHVYLFRSFHNILKRGKTMLNANCSRTHFFPSLYAITNPYDMIRNVPNKYSFLSRCSDLVAFNLIEFYKLRIWNWAVCAHYPLAANATVIAVDQSIVNIIC